MLIFDKKGKPGRTLIYKLKQMIRKSKITLSSLDKTGVQRH